MAEAQPRRTGKTSGRLTAEEITARGFASAFRGISETEVRNFLRRIADEFTDLSERDREMSSRITELEAEVATPPQLSEEQLFDALGRETTRVLRSAQEAAVDIRTHAQTEATELTDEAEAHDRSVRDQAERYSQERRNEADAAAAARERAATETAEAVRAEAERTATETAERATAEADAETERGRKSGRAMVEEARRVRERVLSDLARRRALMEAQLDELRTGRDRLMGAYRVVKETLAAATTALAEVQARAHSADGVAIEPVPEVPDVDIDIDTPADSTEGPTDGPAQDSETPAGDAARSDDETETPTTPTPGSGPTPSETSAGEADPAGANAVDALFARLKQQRGEGATDREDPGPDPGGETAGSASPPGAEGETDATGDSAGDAPGVESPRRRRRRSSPRGRAAATPSDPPEIAARDAATAKVRAALARRAKRALQDGQNDVLDALRRHKGTPTAEDLLGSPEAGAEAWADVLEPAIDEVYRAAARSVTGSGARVSSGVPRSTLVELAAEFAAPLRDQIAGACSPADGTDEDVGQRLGARYREWRAQHLGDALDDVLTAAWVRGTLDATPADARMSWITPLGGCCPDCDDDALEPTERPKAFPTGKHSPPAHSGCRCVLGIAAVEPATTSPS